jgi:fucose permease
MNRQSLTQTVLYALAFIGLGLVTASLGPTLPALAAQTHVTASEISRLFVARAIGTIAASMTLGKLYDRHAGHPVLGVALLGAALLMFALPFIPALPFLFCAFLCVGVCSLVINVGGHTLVVAANREHPALFLNSIHFAFGLGGFLAPLIAKQFAHADNALRWTYGVFAFVLVSITLAAWLTPSPTVVHHEAAAESAQTDKGLFYLLILFFFLEVGGESVVSGWLFSYAVRSGTAETLAYDMNSGFWVAFTLGRLAAIPLIWRLGERTLLLVHLSGWLVLTFALVVLPASSISLWLCAIGMGLGMAPIFPAAMALGQRALRATGKMTGWLLFGAATGGMFSPWMVGQFIGRFGPPVFLWIILIELIAALLVLSRFFAYARVEREPEEAPLLIGEEPL